MSYDPTSLQPGMVVLCLPDPHAAWPARLLDAAIAWSDGPFVHAALVGDGCLIEQVDPVMRAPLPKYATNGWAYRVDGATSDQIARAIAWATARLGQPYGVRELCDDALRLDAHWLPRGRPLHHYTCSGFVALACQQAGVRLTWAPWPTPTDLGASPVLLGPRPRPLG